MSQLTMPITKTNAQFTQNVDWKDTDINPHRRLYQNNSNIKKKSEFRTDSYISLPPYALGAPSGIPMTLKKGGIPKERTEQ